MWAPSLVLSVRQHAEIFVIFQTYRTQRGRVPGRRVQHTLTRCTVALTAPSVAASNAFPKFTTKVPSIGGAGIHSPSLPSTSSPSSLPT